MSFSCVLWSHFSENDMTVYLHTCWRIACFVLYLNKTKFGCSHCFVSFSALDDRKNIQSRKKPVLLILRGSVLKQQQLLLLLLHPFNGLFSRTAWVSQHQKGKPFWTLLEQEMMGWRCHQLDDIQISCTSHQTDDHPIPHHSVFTGRMLFLLPSQQRQSTKGNKWK